MKRLGSVNPVPGEHNWTKSTGPDIDPPEFKIKKGRKKEKRAKGRFEVPKPKDTSRLGTITCSNCGLQGHRYTSCNKNLKPELLLRKNKHVAPARNAHAPATTAPAPAERGTGATAGRGAAAGRGAGRGAGATAGRGAGAGAGRGAGAGIGAGRGGFSAPRWAASASTSGNTGWASYFNASGNR